MPPGAVESSLVDLAFCAGDTRPLHFMKMALQGIEISVLLVLDGATDCPKALNL